jgi:biotin carboxyl carrier protein
LGVLTALGFLVAYALLPRPHFVTAAARLEPFVEVPVPAPFAGPLDQVLVREGDSVETGQPLYATSVAELQARRSELFDRLELLRAPLRKQVARTPEGASLAAALERAETAASRAEAALNVSKTDENEDRLRAAQFALSEARREIDAWIDPNSAQARLADRVADELKAVDAEMDRHTVKAPAPGVVSAIYFKLGQTVAEGQKVMQVDDVRRLKMTATVAPRHARSVEAGAPLTVKIGQDRVDTKVDAVTEDEIVAEVPNPDRTLRTGNVSAELELPARGSTTVP